MAHRITLIPGDGIGPEVSGASRRVIEATGVQVDWDVQEAGAGVMEAEGTPLPDRVLASIRDSRTALKGPITTPVGTGFRSVNVALRQDLDLFAAVRPSKRWPGVAGRHPEVDIVVVRENTEDLYQGVEFERGSRELARLRVELQEMRGYRIRSDAGVTLKPISISGTERIVRFALDLTRRHARKRVTVGHKANIMRYSDGVFLKTALDIDREEYPDVDVETMQIDEMAMHLASEPERFDVLLLPNLYGDIISDLCAGLVGGLGIAPGANLGWDYSLFEPVHGSAPDIAGKGVANPTAMLLTSALMLRHLGETSAADAIERAVGHLLEHGPRTGDMGGDADTDTFTSAVIARMS